MINIFQSTSIYISKGHLSIPVHLLFTAGERGHLFRHCVFRSLALIIAVATVFEYTQSFHTASPKVGQTKVAFQQQHLYY